MQQGVLIYCSSTLFSGENFSSIFFFQILAEILVVFSVNFLAKILVLLLSSQKRNYYKTLVDAKVWL